MGSKAVASRSGGAHLASLASLASLALKYRLSALDLTNSQCCWSFLVRLCHVVSRVSILSVGVFVISFEALTYFVIQPPSLSDTDQNESGIRYNIVLRPVFPKKSNPTARDNHDPVHLCSFPSRKLDDVSLSIQKTSSFHTVNPFLSLIWVFQNSPSKSTLAIPSYYHQVRSLIN